MTSLLEHTIILPENRFLLQSPFLSFSVRVLEKVDQIDRMEMKNKLRLWNGFEYTLDKIACVVLGSGKNRREKPCDLAMIKTKNRRVLREKCTVLFLQLQMRRGKVASFLCIFS